MGAEVACLSRRADRALFPCHGVGRDRIGLVAGAGAGDRSPEVLPMSTLHSCATRGIHRHRPTRGQRPVKPLRSLLAFAALGAAALPSVTRADSAVVISPLATPGQLEVEDAAIALLADPAVVNAREAALELFEADPAATADGKATLVQAV